MAVEPENEAQAASAPVNNRDETQAPPRADAQVAAGRPQMALWFGLLIVYLALFASTGYLAFLNPDRSPAFETQELLAGIEDQATKAFIIEAIKQEDTEHAKRQDFANQSFNVVLGALLGFLSASATSFLRRRGDT